MSYIFISYSRKDSECAYFIQRKLEAMGIKVWIDKSEIEAGDTFPHRIIDAINDADTFIVLWSKNAKNSNYVDAEIQEAINQRMHRKMLIIPVWLDDTDLHTKLVSINAIKFSKCDGRNISKLINKIPASLKETLSRKFLVDDLSGAFNTDDNAELVHVPYLDSWHCEASLIAEANTNIAEHLAQDNPAIILIPQFLGNTSDDTIRQAYVSLKPQLDGQKFVCLHIKPKQDGRIIVDVDERGQQLDAVNTTFEAVFKLVNENRSLATIKLCTPMLSALSASVAYKFDSFWHLQVYHFNRAEEEYYLLFDSKDL